MKVDYPDIAAPLGANSVTQIPQAVAASISPDDVTIIVSVANGVTKKTTLQDLVMRGVTKPVMDSGINTVADVIAALVTLGLVTDEPS
jgi:hypothetical protein